MINIKEKEECCGCSACYNICPANAITMKEDSKGFKYPIIDKEKCTNCNLCEKVCPILNNKKIKNEPVAYACINNDETIRMQSTSGGIFSLLAQKIMEEDGMVIGAGFDEQFNVNHILVDNVQDLYKIRMSKYVQSNIGEMYKDTKKILEEGKKVLFTGTPCQVEGLKSFLIKDYDNLYTQDIICHGVPSPKIWNLYKDYRKNKDNEKNIEKVEFRNKDKSWKEYFLKFSYQDTDYKEYPNKDIFMKLFLSNIILRDSCYNCSFKKKSRLSDITLADFWGVNKVLPNMDDDKGTSLVIVNSTKGEELFNDIQRNIKFEKVSLDEAIKYNPNMIKSSKKNKNSEKYFKKVQKSNFEKLSLKLTKKTFYNKIKNKVKLVIKKLIKKN